MALRTKTCKKCGWVYPYDVPRTRCLFCKEPFAEGICIGCGNESDNLRCGLCIDCYTANKRDSAKKHYERAVTSTQKAFDDWMNLVKQVPANYPTLTNEQWLEACAYFDGCAWCKSEYVNTRGFFIPFKIGGRYSRWNVVPLCEDCAKVSRSVDNPFRFMHRALGMYSYKGQANNHDHWCNSEKRLQKIVDYLRPRLEEAVNDR